MDRTALWTCDSAPSSEPKFTLPFFFTSSLTSCLQRVSHLLSDAEEKNPPVMNFFLHVILCQIRQCSGDTELIKALLYLSPHASRCSAPARSSSLFPSPRLVLLRRLAFCWRDRHVPFCSYSGSVSHCYAVAQTPLSNTWTGLKVVVYEYEKKDRERDVRCTTW